MMNLQYFGIFMYIWWLLKFCGVSFCGNFTKPCRHARTFQLVSQKSLASINNKNPTIFTKRPLVATTVPSGTQRHHWGIGIPGIPSDLRSRPEQSHHLPGALLPQWLQAVCSLQWASQPSTLQKMRLHLLFMIVFWEYGKKRCVIWRKLALWTSN